MKANRDLEVVSGFSLHSPFPSFPAITHCGEAYCSSHHRRVGHSHEGIEITYVSMGSVTWRVGVAEIRQSSGQVSIIPAKRIHSTAARPHPEFKSLYAGIDLTRLGPPGVALDRLLSLKNGLNLGIATEFEPVLRTLYLEALSRRNATHVAQKLAELLLAMIEARLHKTSSTALYSPCSLPTQKAVDFMYRHLHRDVHLRELAAVAHFSSPHFAAKFKKEVGLPPSSFHRIIRLEAARDALASPNASVSQVAYEFGFSSSQHLSTLFRKAFDCTPTEWKRRALHRSLPHP